MRLKAILNAIALMWHNPMRLWVMGCGGIFLGSTLAKLFVVGSVTETVFIFAGMASGFYAAWFITDAEQ